MIFAFALLVLISFGSSFAACGSYASFGRSPDQSLQVFSCDSKKCMVGIRGVDAKGVQQCTSGSLYGNVQKPDPVNSVPALFDAQG